MIPTRLVPAALLVAAAALLTACTATGPISPAPPSDPPAPAASTPPPADTTGWKVDGGGKYVTGTTVICTSLDSIYIEDAHALAGATDVPVSTMVLNQGQISYGTVWPNDKVTVGVTEGAGTYTLTTDASGAPIALHGTATVTWHDKTGSTRRPDTISLTFTPVLNPAKCLGG